MVFEGLPFDNLSEAVNEMKDLGFEGGEAKEVAEMVIEEAEYDSIATVDVDVDGDSKSTFSLDYLKTIFKALNSLRGVEEVKMRWGEQYPMFIGFEQGSIDGEYMLAPRIRSE